MECNLFYLSVTAQYPVHGKYGRSKCERGSRYTATQEQVECDPRDLQFCAAFAGVHSDSVSFHKLRFG